MDLFKKWRQNTPSQPLLSSEVAKPRQPNFFIIGAAKSGTTSLWQYLRQHWDIFMPEDIGWKEPSYYCDTYGVDTYEAYLALFKDAGSQKRIGEASTPYLSSPESARRIRAAVPDAEIIMLLRNPVDRAYSLYKWMFEYGYETIPSFEEALSIELSARKDNQDFIRGKFYKGSFSYYWDYLYFSSGLYYEQVKRYDHLFPKNQLAIIIFEEFAQETLQTVRRLYTFLGVEPDFEPKLKIHNQGAAGYKPLAVDTRRNLEQRYSADVEKLSKLLDKDLRSLWFSTP